MIAAWALLRKRAWFEAGAAVTPPALGRLRPSIELRAEQLPDQDVWDAARTNAAKLFGYTIPRTYLTGANVAEFAAQVRTQASESVSELAHLVGELDKAHQRLGAEVGDDDRLAAARALQEQAQRLQNTAGNVALIDAMAGLTLPVALETAAQIRVDAARDSRSLRNFKWQLVDPLHAATSQAGGTGDAARALQKRLQEAIAIPGRAMSDELTAAENKLVEWVVSSTPTDTPPPPASTRERVLSSADDLAALTAELTAAVANDNQTVHVQWWLQ